MSLDKLVEVLSARRALGDWSARERDASTVTLSGAPDNPLARVVRDVDLSARVHVDGPTGRGSADLEVDDLAADGPIAAPVDEAIARAQVSIGPAWQSSPPGAPAKVALVDLTHTDDDAAARELHARLLAAARDGGADVVSAEVSIERASVALATSRGLVARWDETTISFDVRVAIGGATARAAQTARRHRGLRAVDRVKDAIARARARADAIEPASGPRPVLLPALVLGGDGAGLLDALAELADATLQRQGLARARVGAAIVDGAITAVEPLELASDGTLAWGVRSAPLGDHGEPVRRFPIVDGGRLVGLGLGEREAALLGEPPNGGVRNLVIGAGASDAAALRDGGALELSEIEYVDVEPLTARVAIGIGLGTLHDDAGPRTVAGRELQGDLVAAFAASRRTRDQVRAGPYSGPSLIWLTGLEVV